jgi:hypothetical protein
MPLSRLIAILSLTAISMPVLAASEEDTDLARNYLRCASFYVFGSMSVTRPELKQQLSDLANRSLYSAELLMDKNRPVVKEEFNAAREKFLAELGAEEVKTDSRGFLNYMGEYCTALREKNQARFSKE